jgi:glyoxylase-like metal-dependent hydrolase (beta-lactamase superfamily II)
MAHCAANLVALLLLSASSVFAQGETAKITDGVYAFNLGAVELPYTSMFVVTGNGVMVVDPINSNSARVMLQEIRKITNEPIRYVFYSHDHWDHTSGGQVFKNEGAEIIAHTDASEWIKTHTGANQIPADSSWSGSRKEYSLGGFTMELHQFGPSHGNGMTIFVVNSQPRVVYVADLAAVKSTGPVYLPEFDTKGWENTLEKTLQLNFEKGVFTHSPPQGGTKQDLADHLGYVKDIRAGVKAELRKGTNPFAIPGVLKLDKYKDWAGYADQFPLNVMHFAIEEAVLGPYASPAKKKNSIRSGSSGSSKWHIKAGY